jgi:hypothetical protein
MGNKNGDDGSEEEDYDMHALTKAEKNRLKKAERYKNMIIFFN